MTEPERTSPTANTPGAGGREGRGERASVVVPAGLDEAGAVQLQAAVEPFGVWFRADHHEHVRDRLRLARTGIAIDPGDFAQEAVAAERCDLGAGVHA